MDSIKQYVITITAAAILCMLVNAIFPAKNAYGGILKLFCGVVFTIILVSPVNNFCFADYNWFWESIFTEANIATEEGVAAFNGLLSDSIKDKTTAYILDKANEYDMDLNIQVELENSSPPVPENIIISGNSTPHQREQFRLELSNELGLPKERILWQWNP